MGQVPWAKDYGKVCQLEMEIKEENSAIKWQLLMYDI